MAKRKVIERIPDAPARPGEAELVASLLQGDEAAFEDLVDQHHDTMLRVARLFVRTPDVAEEVVQETWMAILKALPTFEGRSSLRTWMFRILFNRARTRAKREGRTLPFSAVGDNDAGPPGEPPFDAQGLWSQPPRPWEALDRLEEAELHAQIERAIETLPPRQRTVITLRDLKGWTSAEVCNALGISETNQRVLLHRARAKVRDALDDTLAGEAA
jgi:RNA polymerase sigma-70 factor (ECF subfamily)